MRRESSGAQELAPLAGVDFVNSFKPGNCTNTKARRDKEMIEGNGYILTEIWENRPSWMELSTAARADFFQQRIGPLIGEMLGAGAEFLGCAINDNEGEERIDYRYMAVWRMPSKELSERLESSARSAGFLDYFEQVNFSGTMITPDIMNADMFNL